MLKKISFLSCYNCLQCSSYAVTPGSNTSLCSRPPSRSRSSLKSKIPSQWRSFTDVRHKTGTKFRNSANWPTPKTPGQPPTPYEIFELETGAVYSKHRFYELVKIYHPDRNGLEGTYCEGISQLEKLERYRLVVLAHQILSDPVRRQAYDISGAGWSSQERSHTRHTRGYYAAGARRPFGTGPDYDSSIFANATWEDWERWYHRNDRQEQQAYKGTFMNSNAFASFVILMAVISGVAQATRAGQRSGSVEEKAKAFTEETSRFLTSRQEEYKENNLDSGGRIKYFLEKRDPSRYGLKEEEEETYRKHFAQDALPPGKSSIRAKPPD